MHETVGPARATISDIARRACVSRVTVYHHLPDDAALLGACSGMWAEEHQPPDLRGRRRDEAGVPIGLALEFGIWRALVRGSGLGSDRAASLMTELIVAASARAPD